MLTAKEVGTLQWGNYPNSHLRSKFGTKHGTVVKARTIATKTKDPEDIEFIGNRSQARWRRKNPLGRIKLRANSRYQSNRIENVDRQNAFRKMLKAIGKLFKYLLGL